MKNKKIKQIILLALLAIGLVVGLLVVAQQQDLRKRATGSGEVDMVFDPAPGNYQKGQSFQTKIKIHKLASRSIDISGAEAIITIPSQLTVSSASCVSPFDGTPFVTQSAQTVTLLCAIGPGTGPVSLGTDVEIGSIAFTVKSDAQAGSAPITFTSTRVTEAGVSGQAPDVSTSGQSASYTIASISTGSYGCTFVRAWGSFGTGNGQFQNSAGIAELNGKLYVADIYNNRIQVFSKDGIYQSQFGIEGNGNGQFSHPNDIVTGSGRLYIVDKDNHRIQVFDENGQYISQFGSFGSGDGQFNFPGSVEYYSGKIYVGDGFNNRIQVFDENGTFLFKWGSEGVGDGQFKVVGVSDIDPSGIVYVIDRDNNRIQYFQSNGTFIGKFGYSGSGDGQFNSPSGVTLSEDGHIFVSDYYNDRVHIYDANKTFLTTFGTTGANDGQFNDGPTKLFFSPPNSLYVADASNHRVQLFQCTSNLSATSTPSPSPPGSTGTETPSATPTEISNPTATPSPTMVIPPTETPTPTITPTPPATLTPTPPSNNYKYNYDIGTKQPLSITIGSGGATGDGPMIRFKARLANQHNHPDIVMKLRIINEDALLAGATYSCQDTGSAGKDFSIPMRADGDGVYTPSQGDGWVNLSGILPGDHYSFYLKGPKTRSTSEAKYVVLQLGKGAGQDFDWTSDGQALHAGDLPDPNNSGKQDCTVNIVDLTLIEANHAKTDRGALDIADVNYDGIVSGQDIAIVVDTLSTRSDDDQ